MNIPDVTGCSSLAEGTRIIMLAQEGVSEIGTTNTGPEVNEYLKFVHLDPGYAWCSALLCWSIGQAAKQLNITPQFQYAASVYKLWHLNQELIINLPEPDCVVLKNEGLNSLGRPIGHAMFLLGINTDNSLNVISGNTNQQGSREGTSVVVQNRNLKELSLGYGFLKVV